MTEKPKFGEVEITVEGEMLMRRPASHLRETLEFLIKYLPATIVPDLISDFAKPYIVVHENDTTSPISANLTRAMMLPPAIDADNS